MQVKEGKKEQVREMFNNISGKYDFLNHFLSMGIDVLWRKKLVRKLKKEQPERILDVATGTGDLAITALRTNAKEIVGIDISEGMLEVGKQKIKKKGLEDKIKMQLADSEKLPFENDSFDASMVAFGVRNFENLDKGLGEMYRCISPKGSIWVLEFSKPKKFPVKQLYNFYFKNILPLIGRMVSKDDFAYTYLPESVQEFPDGKNFIAHLEKAGFKSCKIIPVSFGIASIYVGYK
ncbi:MAG: bifunctional demethylmenaquinone methyltransferase/2-methoxy-6-polyprenyl-1,4-benzoquinol methylase UbiE [Bacteroidetes bacterium]|nr:bifunctional demethylmenaquinone methyltransferase/2-methoxy-6-polyprenyl-1,4-benzoquinol methylase UbiE [Bacteroidota bacterium]|tara:strand:+ start:749 stop:1453 length:705 start_codon:yes stop_codon:yes gene_type:complete